MLSPCEHPAHIAPNSVTWGCISHRSQRVQDHKYWEVEWTHCCARFLLGAFPSLEPQYQQDMPKTANLGLA